MGLGLVERLEESDDIALISRLRRRKAGLVDAVIDQVILPLVRFLDLLSQRLRIQVHAAVLFIDDIVELKNFVSLQQDAPD